MLTGSTVVLPLVYIVLNLTPMVVTESLNDCLGRFVFGYHTPVSDICRYLSPVTAIGGSFGFTSDSSGLITLSGVWVPGVYAAIGLLMAVAAVFIFRKRNMETAGDVVAVKCLKPIFRYCMSLGTALVLADVVSAMLPVSLFRGIRAAAVILLLMLAGAVIGYYASEMMMRKTLRVSGVSKKGLVIVCTIFALFVVSFEADLFGYEDRIPEKDETEYMLLDGTMVEDSGSMEALRELHRSFVEKREESIPNNDRDSCIITYVLNNGSVIRRKYPMNIGEDAADDPQSLVSRVYDFYSRPDIILNTILPDFPVIPENIRSSYIYCDVNSADRPDSIALSPEETCDFYEQCILPDIMDGNLGRSYPDRSSAGLNEETNCYISVDMSERTAGPDGYPVDGKWGGIYLNISFSAERCMKWLEENTDFEIVSRRQLNEMQEGADIYGYAPAAEAG